MPLQQGDRLLAVGRVVIDQRDLLAFELVEAESNSNFEHLPVRAEPSN